MSSGSRCSLTGGCASIDDYLNASEVFPGVGFKGGICYFLWDRDNPGDCRVTTHFSGRGHVLDCTRPLLEDGADVFIRYNEGAVDPQEGRCGREWWPSNSLDLPDDKQF